MKATLHCGLLACIIIAAVVVLTATAPVHTEGRGLVTWTGGQLYLNGTAWMPVGVNAYSLATYWPVNSGCGDQIDDLDGFFRQTPAHGITRIWAWQGAFAVNKDTHQIDWTGIDRVVQAAERTGRRLILSLASQSGDCDDGVWKDLAWYREDYRVRQRPESARLPLSYLDYVRAIVTRYRSSPAIAMWEPINEPEVSECPPGRTGSACFGLQRCPDEERAATALRWFFDAVGAEIRSIDPLHLIESGTIGAGQCGTSGAHYEFVHASPGINVASFHDYAEGATTYLPGDDWNGLARRLLQTGIDGVNKPLLVGEAGIRAGGAGPSCPTLPQRRDRFRSKMDTQFRAGIAGFLVWSWMPYPEAGCTYETVTSTDPLMAMLRNYQPPPRPNPLFLSDASPSPGLPVPPGAPAARGSRCSRAGASIAGRRETPEPAPRRSSSTHARATLGRTRHNG